MKTLITSEIAQIAGGDYHVTIEMDVPSSAALYFSAVAGSIVAGKITNTSDLITLITNYQKMGGNFNNIKIDSIEYADFKF